MRQARLCIVDVNDPVVPVESAPASGRDANLNQFSLLPRPEPSQAVASFPPLLPSLQSVVEMPPPCGTGGIQVTHPQSARASKAAGPLSKHQPFQLGDFVAAIKSFLTCDAPYNHAIAPPERARDESTSDYIIRLRRTVNAPPKGFECIKKLIPSIIRYPGQYSDVLSEGGASPIKDTILKLSQWFNSKLWSGFSALCPFPDMQDFRYGYQRGMSCSLLELSRRALNLEGALRRLSQYILEVTETATSLSVIPVAAQHSARLLSEFGVGLNGDGRGFYNPPTPKQAQVLKRLENGASSKSEELRGFLQFLRSKREEAFTQLYVVDSPLCWLLPTLAFLFDHRGLLADVRDPAKLEQLHAAVMEEWKERSHVYEQCTQPLAKYGGYLTR